jgi:PAS domain S-box-containing protein
MAPENGREELEKKINELEKEVRRYKTAWKALEKGEEWFLTIVKSSPIATFVIDTQHRVITCNRAYEKLTGIPAEKIIGTDNYWMTFYDKKRSVLADFVLDQVPEDIIKKYYGNKLRKSPTTEGAYEAEDYFPHLSGGGKWMYFTAAPLKDAGGKVIGALETLQDITEKKQAENRLIESEKRIRIFFEFVPYPIVIFTRRGRVYYVNPAFTETFGWTREELQGGTIPWKPPGMEDLPAEAIETFFDGNQPRRYETKRRTKDGRIIDVIVRTVSYSSAHGKAAGILMIQRDVTQEKREARINETMHRISLTLPEYPDLKELLDFIVDEVRQLIESETANLILYDEERSELVFFVTAHENQALGKRINETRFSLDQLMAGSVIKTGRPIIDNQARESARIFKERDVKLGFQTRNVAQVPLWNGERIIGILAAANKKEGQFEQSDIELLNTIGSTVALSIENARYSSELQKAYQEVRSLNIAKGKLIHHLSHELKTPVAILSGSISILTRQLTKLPDTAWQKTLDRINRNLNRIVEIQSEVSDIVQIERYEIQTLLSRMLDQCTDELETLIEEETGKGNVIDVLKKRIDDIFGPKDLTSKTIRLGKFVEERLESLKPQFAHRSIQLTHAFESSATAFIPQEALAKIVDGLVKNAVENTPDGGKIEISIQKKGKGAVLVVRDYGIGILEDAKKRIFEGFFPTRDTLSYSSKRPFDFQAGGKGADLLRMKIFSERYNFKIDMSSTRCPVIPKEEDTCPGNIHDCPDCSTADDCYGSGGTIFSLYFPPQSDQEAGSPPA